MAPSLEQFELIGRAVSDRTRIRILKLLGPGELCVCQVTAILGLAPATISKHLSLLRIAGLASQRRDGRWVYYSLASHTANPYARALLDLLDSGLAEDPVIAEDQSRLVALGNIPLEEVIRHGRRLFETRTSLTES